HVPQAPATALPAAEQGLTEALQAPLSPGAVPAAGASTGVTQAQRQALQEYWNTVRKWQLRQQTRRQGWMPADRSTGLVPLWRKVEEAKRRCLCLGVEPERDRR